MRRLHHSGGWEGAGSPPRALRTHARAHTMHGFACLCARLPTRLRARLRECLHTRLRVHVCVCTRTCLPC